MPALTARPALTALALIAAVSSVRAHFVFVVPEADGGSAKVLMSEDLKPDAQVNVSIIGGASLHTLDAAGKTAPLPMSPLDDHAMKVAIEKSARVIYGVADLGVMQRGNAKPNWLRYFPKTVIGDPTAEGVTLGDKAPVEIVPVRIDGKLRLKLLADGKPVGSGDVNMVPAEGDEESLAVNADGLTDPIDITGRVGFWARNIKTTAGELNGKKYEEVRRYATLVIDIPIGHATTATTTATTQPATRPAAVAHWPVEPFTPLPEPASSFGAVAAGGYLYVYGGHVVDTHDYSDKSVSGRFHRLKLDGGNTWETLPAGPHLQGLNLAAKGDVIYRVGGMAPKNAEGQDENIRSVADVAAFAPAVGKWAALPPLPQPRSSHDVAVIGDTLYVVGGWTLAGEAGSATWHDDLLVLDLTNPKSGWKTLPQPFKRRALIASVYHGKLYAIGGFQEDDEPSLATNIYDPATNAWTPGPALPGPALNGFGPAAAVSGGRLFASVGDGSLLRLTTAGDAWEQVATTTKRIVHRMASDGDRLLILGGAAGRKQQTLIEAVRVRP